MPLSQADWRKIRQDWAAQRALPLAVERAWGRLPDGRRVILPAATESEKRPNSWWLGFDEEALADASVAGAVLLCRTSGGRVLDFGLPVERLREIAPRLVRKGATSHREFTVTRHGGRHLLHLRDGETMEIDDRLGELRWLTESADLPLVAQDPAAKLPQAHVGPPEDCIRFFARMVGGRLEPMDPVPMQEGAAYHVVVRPAPAVPLIGAIRRMLAEACDLGQPVDFSEHHDHYIHGTPKR